MESTNLVSPDVNDANEEKQENILSLQRRIQDSFQIFARLNGYNLLACGV